MVTNSFTHYLITRFNIPVETYGPEKMNSAHMNEAFIRHRLTLFEKYCVPSVLHQTTKDFTWLLYFDKSTPNNILEQVIALIQDAVKIEIHLVGSFDEFLQNTREHILNSSTQFCITSRLDNDDVISQDFIQSVQQRFIPTHRVLINFTRGFEIDLSHQIIKKWSARYKNQFTSLIENKEMTPLSGIYGFAHGAIPGDISILNIGESPRWAYTRHEFNFSPQKINAKPVFSLGFLDRFPSLKGQISISWWNSAQYTRRWLWKTSKDRIKNLIKR